MVFSSVIFLFLFLPVVLATYLVVPRSVRNLLLLGASPFFYAWGEMAFVSVMLLMRELSKYVPAMKAARLEDFDLQIRETPARPFLLLTGIRDFWTEELIELRPRRPRAARRVRRMDKRRAGSPTEPRTQFLVGSTLVKETGAADFPRAVMFHDSFARVALEPFLSEHFERIAYHWRSTFDTSVILREQPDVVIEERAERFFLEHQPRNPPELLR